MAIDTLARWMSSDPEVAAQVEAAQRAGRDKPAAGLPGASPSPSSPKERDTAAHDDGWLRAASKTEGPGDQPEAPTDDRNPLRFAPGRKAVSGGQPGGDEHGARDRWAQVHAEAAALGPGLYGYVGHAAREPALTTCETAGDGLPTSALHEPILLNVTTQTNGSVPHVGPPTWVAFHRAANAPR